MPTTNIRATTGVTAPGERTIWLAGEIDIAVADRVESVLRWSVRDSGAERVVVDLSCLTFIDARGSRALELACRGGQEVGVPVTIVGARGIVHAVLALLRIIDIGQDLPAPPLTYPAEHHEQ